MKNKLIVILLIMFGNSFLYPQDIKNYGIKIGLTSSSISINNIKPLTIGEPIVYVNYPTEQLISPTISLWAKLITGNIFNLEVEATYILKGSSENRITIVSPGNDPYLITGMDKSVTFKYLQVNVNSQIKQNLGDVSIYGIVGPTIGYLINGENFVLLKNFKKDFIFGYNLGLGIKFNKSIFFELKYNGDFTNFYKNDYDEYWNKVFVLYLGTTF